MFKKVLAFVVISSLGTNVSSSKYSRKDVQKEYPGFGTEWIPMGLRENGSYIIGYFNSSPGEQRFNLFPSADEAIKFTLFTRSHPEGIQINSTENLDQIFDKNKPTKFVTHGWLAKGTDDTCIKIKDGFLEKYDANVFIMDWNEISGNVIYPIPMARTKSVGDEYSKFITHLVDLGADPNKMHLVGHSLGAHVSGFAARGVKGGKIGRVTGLDPALPGFNKGLVDGGNLNAEDAEFVDVIHTCAGFLGYSEPLGHADFYPNGGSVPQPGCDGIVGLMEACSHGRSWHYFAESLTASDPFMAYNCNSFDSFLQLKDCSEEGVPMGDPAPSTARGQFYLVTDQKTPFALGDDLDNGI